jgi:hypothetical protein
VGSIADRRRLHPGWREADLHVDVEGTENAHRRPERQARRCAALDSGNPRLATARHASQVALRPAAIGSSSPHRCRDPVEELSCCHVGGGHAGNAAPGRSPAGHRGVLRHHAVGRALSR